jgi:hypothetical protein
MMKGSGVSRTEQRMCKSYNEEGIWSVQETERMLSQEYTWTVTL